VIQARIKGSSPLSNPSAASTSGQRRTAKPPATALERLLIGVAELRSRLQGLLPNCGRMKRKRVADDGAQSQNESQRGLRFAANTGRRG
jgi:hypothetical protein